MTQSISIKVPATTANVGPGFDCMGMALTLYNQFTFTPQDAGLAISVSGEGAAIIPESANNLIVKAMKYFCEAGGYPFPDVHINQVNHVPAASGMGSSSTAVIAGLLGANGLLGFPATPDDILQLATKMEGHPDNVAPALFGGLVVVPMDASGEAILVERINVPPLTVLIVLPDFQLLTSDARAALPTEVSRADAIYNLSRTPLVVRALEQGNYAKLGKVLDDRLHQPYRMALIPGMADAFEAAKAAGASAITISGAGPGSIVFAPHGHKEIGEAMIAAYAQAGLKARKWELTLDPCGSVVNGKVYCQ
ncbi:MAG: homoserine kinase [Chloroflexota bacterium]